MRFGRLDGSGSTRRALQAESHDRLVDRSDLSHGEGAVRESLAVEDHELFEYPIDNAIGDHRRLDAVTEHAADRPWAPFEEVVAVGIEQVPMARRQAERSVAPTVMDQPEEAQELSPGAEPLIHRVGVATGILAQALEQPRHRVV